MNELVFKRSLVPILVFTKRVRLVMTGNAIFGGVVYFMASLLEILAFSWRLGLICRKSWFCTGDRRRFDFFLFFSFPGSFLVFLLYLAIGLYNFGVTF